jgi:hypothetical protein
MELFNSIKLFKLIMDGYLGVMEQPTGFTRKKTMWQLGIGPLQLPPVCERSRTLFLTGCANPTRRLIALDHTAILGISKPLMIQAKALPGCRHSRGSDHRGIPFPYNVLFI